MTNPFPDSRAAAVSFTYDDGLDVHLDHAMPDLEAAGLRGTFYIPTRQQPTGAWPRRPTDWKAAVERGHEIGNHTQHHPCAAQHPWVPRGFTLEEYDLTRMETELLAANQELRTVVGPTAGQSFAYTCCEPWVSPAKVSYRPLTARLFTASRGGSRDPLTANPTTVDLSDVPSWALTEQDALPRILTFLDQAIEHHHWAVLQFHGVGGGHKMNVSRDVHQAICAHASQRRNALWCGPFVEVAAFLRSTIS